MNGSRLACPRPVGRGNTGGAAESSVRGGTGRDVDAAVASCIVSAFSVCMVNYEKNLTGSRRSMMVMARFTIGEEHVPLTF